MTKLTVITAVLGMMMTGFSLPAASMEMEHETMKSDKMMHNDMQKDDMMKKDDAMNEDKEKSDEMKGDVPMEKKDMMKH